MSEENKNLQDPHPIVEGYENMPPALQSYFKLKKALRAPDLIRDEEGLSAKRFTKSYYEDTCPYCETTAEHEGRKYRYSKATKRKLMINFTLMLVIAVLTGTGLLNLYIGLGVIAVIGYSTSLHAERKMYYTMLCRRCGANFPMDQQEKDRIRMELREKQEAQSSKDQEGLSPRNAPEEESSPDEGDTETEQ